MKQGAGFPHTDTEVLDLIEDFLVNHCAVDEMKMLGEPVSERLQHISDLVGHRHAPFATHRLVFVFT